MPTIPRSLGFLIPHCLSAFCPKLSFWFLNCLPCSDPLPCLSYLCIVTQTDCWLGSWLPAPFEDNPTHSYADGLHCSLSSGLAVSGWFPSCSYFCQPCLPPMEKFSLGWYGFIPWMSPYLYFLVSSPHMVSGVRDLVNVEAPETSLLKSASLFCLEGQKRLGMWFRFGLKSGMCYK